MTQKFALVCCQYIATWFLEIMYVRPDNDTGSSVAWLELGLEGVLPLIFSSSLYSLPKSSIAATKSGTDIYPSLSLSANLKIWSIWGRPENSRMLSKSMSDMLPDFPVCLSNLQRRPLCMIGSGLWICWWASLSCNLALKCSSKKFLSCLLPEPSLKSFSNWLSPSQSFQWIELVHELSA